MAIDITNQEQIRKLTLDDLMEDAVERKDKEALRWLEDEAFKTTTRKNKAGEEITVSKPLISIRAEYLRKFLGYVPAPSKSYNSEKEKAKRDAEKRAKFAAAFARL
jgi:hypothetical protein